MTLRTRRVLVGAAVVALLAVMAALDGVVARGQPPALPAVQASAASAVVPVGAGTSAWFCAGGSGPAAGAEETVVVTDPTSQAASGTLTAVSSDGQRRSVPVQVAAGGVTTAVPAQLLSGAWVSAIVLMDRAGIAVTETVASTLGWADAPCASTTATHWLFTGQNTEGNDDVALSILNPTVTPAVVDVALVTSGGQRLVPPAYQGVTVPPSSLVVETLSSHDESDPSIATAVTAVSGTVVAAELEASSASGAHGLSLTLGAVAPATTWTFPATEVIPDGKVSFDLYDPSSRPAVAHLALGLRGATVAPVAVTVPAGRQAAVPLDGLPQVPVGVPFAVTVTATAPVVVARVVDAPASGPEPHWGLQPGTASSAAVWDVPPVTSPGVTAWQLVVAAGTSRPVSVTVAAVGASGATHPAAGLSGVTVEPSVPLVVTTPPAPIGAVPLVVQASGPVAVQLDPEPEGAPGVVEVPAEPVG